MKLRSRILGVFRDCEFGDIFEINGGEMEGGGKSVSVAVRSRNGLTMKLVEERQMTDIEIDAIASLLFSWWKREFEHKSREPLEGTLRGK